MMGQAEGQPACNFRRLPDPALLTRSWQTGYRSTTLQEKFWRWPPGRHPQHSLLITSYLTAELAKQRGQLGRMGHHRPVTGRQLVVVPVGRGPGVLDDRQSHV